MLSAVISSFPLFFQEICDDPQYVSAGASRFDVQQGELGKFHFFKRGGHSLSLNIVGFSYRTQDTHILLIHLQKLRIMSERTQNRESYKCAHVLLNLFNKLGKSDKMVGLPSILLLFCKFFDKLNKTGAGILDSTYHTTLKVH